MRGRDRRRAALGRLDEEGLEELGELIERLRLEVAEGAILVVEGRKDADALRGLGFRGSVLPAKSRGSRLVDFAERIDVSHKVILLTDFDHAGMRLAQFLRKALERERAKVDLTYRKRLAALMHGEVKDIEGLAQRLEKLRRLERAASGQPTRQGEAGLRPERFSCPEGCAAYKPGLHARRA
ncbi:MAG: toprim domain-containing protein [Candidatus Bathyarchaeia archaeon]